MASQAEQSAFRQLPAMAVLVATLVVFVLHASSGFITLTNARGDNDSLLRLVEVRDLLAGQRWYDLHQYRLGLVGGMEMHWSRLVDAPIAALSFLFGETVTLVAWPLLCFAIALYFLIGCAAQIAGRSAVLPAAVLGALALFSTGTFEPGALDHHNVQLTLAIAMIFYALRSVDAPIHGLAAGVCGGLSLAVGMETAPYVAAAGAAMAIAFLAVGRPFASAAAQFGVGFAATAAVVLLVTVPASAWTVRQCDAFSVVQFGIAVVAGGGLALVCGLPGADRSVRTRALGLLAVAVAVACIVLVVFPGCIADPYAQMDPRVRDYLLSHIPEAQPVWRLMLSDPALVISTFATPVIALIVLAASIRREGPTPQLLIVSLMIAAATAVATWQLRGASFACCFSVIALSAWVTQWLSRLRAGLPLAALKTTLVCLASTNLLWGATAAHAVGLLAPRSAPRPDIEQQANCGDAHDFAALASLPATRIASIFNLGAGILRYTSHSALAGPYHRNNAGNARALEILTAAPDAARSIVNGEAVELLAICRGNDESRLLATIAPDGLYANLLRGNVPLWLKPVPGTAGAKLEIFRAIQPAS